MRSQPFARRMARNPDLARPQRTAARRMAPRGATGDGAGVREKGVAEAEGGTWYGPSGAIADVACVRGTGAAAADGGTPYGPFGATGVGAGVREKGVAEAEGGTW